MTETTTRNHYLVRVLERFKARMRGQVGGPALPVVHFSLIINGTAFGGFILPGDDFDGLIADLALRREPGESERYVSENVLAPDPEATAESENGLAPAPEAAVESEAFHAGEPGRCRSCGTWLIGGEGTYCVGCPSERFR